jgi:hypothetical protein
MAKRQDGAKRGQKGADQTGVGDRIETAQERAEKLPKTLFQRLGHRRSRTRSGGPIDHNGRHDQNLQEDLEVR